MPYLTHHLLLLNNPIWSKTIQYTVDLLRITECVRSVCSKIIQIKQCLIRLFVLDVVKITGLSICFNIFLVYHAYYYVYIISSLTSPFFFRSISLYFATKNHISAACIIILSLVVSKSTFYTDREKPSPNLICKFVFLTSCLILSNLVFRNVLPPFGCFHCIHWSYTCVRQYTDLTTHTHPYTS